MTSGEVVPVRSKYRNSVPDAHKGSLDTRLAWLWNQRFGTIQSIWRDTKDTLDKTACTLILQAILAKDLQSIELLFRRIEGGAIQDEQLQQTSMRL